MLHLLGKNWAHIIYFGGDWGGSKRVPQTGSFRPQKVLFIVLFLSLYAQNANRSGGSCIRCSDPSLMQWWPELQFRYPPLRTCKVLSLGCWKKNRRKRGVSFFKSLLMPFFSRGFSRGKAGPSRHSRGSGPIRSEKRHIRRGTHPNKVNGLFLGTPPWWKTAEEFYGFFKHFRLFAFICVCWRLFAFVCVCLPFAPESKEPESCICVRFARVCLRFGNAPFPCPSFP